MNRLCGIRHCVGHTGRDHALIGQRCQNGRVKQSEVTVEVDHQNGDEHQNRTEQSIKEKLNRRVFTTWTTPDTDQEIHRQKHHFPKHIEQEEIQRQKNSDHPGFQKQKQDTVSFHVFLNGPASQNRKNTNPRGQQN